MTRWGRRALAGAVTIATVGIWSCIDFGAPATGVASITTLILPSPSIIIGDVLRDSLGAAAPLTVTAFDGSGNPLPNEHISYFALDSTIQVDSNGLVRGIIRDTVGGRIAASAGALQTQPVHIPVSVRPETAVGTGAAEIDFNSLVDSTNLSNQSAALVVTLAGPGAVGAQGFIVDYQITRSPSPLHAGDTTAYLVDDASKPSLRDTTGFQGQTSRRVILRPLTFGDSALQAGGKTDTIIVHATVKFLGSTVAGSPIDFILPLKKKP